MNAIRTAVPGPRVTLTALKALAAGLAVLLASCGGGGPDAGAPPFGNINGGGNGGSSGLPASSTLAQRCAPDNPLAATASRTGSLDVERRWVRSYMDEAYLWYREVPSVDSTRTEFNLVDVPTSLDNYFNALRTPALTASGKRKDQFSFTFPTAEWNALSQSGVVAGFGAEWALGSTTPPRNIRIAYVDPGTPAPSRSTKA